MTERGQRSVDLRGRSIEVMHVTLGNGLGVTRGLWVRVAPKNTLLKALLAPLLILFLAVVVAVAVFVFLALLLLASLASLLSRHRGRSAAGTIIEGKAEERE
jgi:hypothetical protein